MHTGASSSPPVAAFLFPTVFEALLALGLSLARLTVTDRQSCSHKAALTIKADFVLRADSRSRLVLASRQQDALERRVDQFLKTIPNPPDLRRSLTFYSFQKNGDDSDVEDKSMIMSPIALMHQ